MRTNDFTAQISSKQLNENMFKKFGVKVNFDKYDREQLENYRNILRTKIHQTEVKSNFNALLSNESYQKDKHMMDLLNARIKEMLGEGKLPMKTVKGKKVPAFAADGKGKNDLSKKKQAKEGLDPVGKEDDDVDNDGKKNTKSDQYLKSKRAAVSKAIAKDSKVKESIVDKVKGAVGLGKKAPATTAEKNAAARQKHSRMASSGNDKDDYDYFTGRDKVLGGEKKIKEGKASAAEMAHAHALEYAKHHSEGNLEMAQHHRDACESCGGKLTHGKGGKVFHQHGGVNNGGVYECGMYEGDLAGMAGAGLGALVGGPVGAIAGSAMGSAMEGLKGGQKKLDKNHNNKLDADDFDKLRAGKESKMKKVKEGITESIARFIAEDEEGKAKSITAGLDMVNDFTSWMQRIATYQTKSMIELSDQIRAHFGDAEAQRFKEETYAALEQSLSALTQSREQLSQSVAVLAGEAPAQEPMGTEPSMDTDIGGDPGAELAGVGDDMEAPEDEFSAADAAAGGPETTGRMKRESIERGNRLMKILGA